MKAVIESSHLEFGTERWFFDYEYEITSEIMTDSWIKETWRFMSKHNIQFMEIMSDCRAGEKIMLI